MLQPSVRARRRVWLALALLGAAPSPAVAQTSHPSGKIAITTSSEAARADFVKGRHLAENLRLEDSRQHFRSAITKDPGFALAHLSLANSSPTGTEFFEHLGHAVKLADKASPGERLMIKGAEAGANADPAGQLALYQKLVAEYGNDERAHFLLGNAYFGRQEYDKAITEYGRATQIAPEFAPAYNIVGYAYRTVGRYDQAEQAFKKYIQLIPNDPNPYDSYAELLMKMGRFDESIAQYRKALEVNPQFSPSYTGIATNLTFQGKYDAARAEAKKLYDAARNDGDKRAAMFAHTITYLDEGKTDLALAELEKQYALGKGTNDAAGMAGDATSMGNVLLATGKPAEALKRFDQAAQVVEASQLSSEVKENAKLIHRYNVARVAVATGDLAKARGENQVFMREAEAKKNPFQIRLAHEVEGMIALAEKSWDGALAHLAQANLQDPYNLYRQALAYEGKGDQAKAREKLASAVGFNQLPTINSALVRMKARHQKA
ncbi:MAG TPA: tetratricopeptide repeat protein [Gemmatimonadales bacterium]|nr:tetratricopeptide repeat protein [Gemmatimonadales bacterium]